MIAGLFIMMKKIFKKKIIIIYLVYALVFGILYMLIMPFPASPDENRHFVKIYSVTEGYIFPSDDTILPDGLDLSDQYELKYEKLKEDSQRKADRGNMRRYDLSRTVFYFPAVYLPQTIGMTAAKAFTDKVYLLALAGRICGYLFNVCLITAALCLAPCCENIIFLAVFNPIFMQQAVSLSGDSMVNALAVFLTAYLLALRGKTKDKLWPLFILFPLIGICKMFYLPMLLLVFIVDEKIAGNKKKAIKVRAAVIALTLILSLLWVYTASRSRLYIAAESTGSNAGYILQDLPRYILIILRSCISEGRTWIRQTFGGNLGWIAVNVFMPFILIYILMFIYAALTEKSVLERRDKVIVIICDIIIFLLVLTTEYIQWTSYGADVIDGVQGRYFLPVIPLSFICLSNKRPVLPKKHLNIVLYGYTALYNTAALVTVFNAFSG